MTDPTDERDCAAVRAQTERMLAALRDRRRDGERARAETPTAILCAAAAGLAGREIARALDLNESYVYRTLRTGRENDGPAAATPPPDGPQPRP